MPPSIAITDLVRYKLDLTGSSIDNLISDEVKVLEGIGTKRAVVPKYGPFYTETLIVYNDLTGDPLTEKVDYIAAQLNTAATSRSGKEICGILIFLNTSLSRVRYSYQCVGGPYMLTVDAMVDMISNLNLDDRPVYWGQILGKPSLFPPGHHLHDVGDVFGFEYLVLILEELRKAILIGDDASHQEIYDYIDAATADNAHFSNTNNPHQTTAAQVGAYTVAEIDSLLSTITQALTSHSHSKLVNGTAEATLSPAGYFMAPEIGIPSDERLKKDISAINNSLDIIRDLYGIWYTKIDTDVKSVGLIAQNVQAVIPEAVRVDENGILSVLYPNLVGLLVNGIKELESTVIEQKLIIEEHSKQIKELKELILSWGK